MSEVGDRIGPYRLREILGEGGMGVVYLADQSTPVQRKVALKLIKLGMDTRQVVSRFEAERQTLALLDHPHIAKVYDGGASETGRPYFVMELVRGQAITRYCDVERLSTRERLELFVLVCHAIQHAHQKGIIHRDLKPSNVLVSEQDGHHAPKVIDFGIAKATDARAEDGGPPLTCLTEQGALIGTPEYMSPEQADPSVHDIDTRTDVYSLGVLLYELLTGVLPFGAGLLRGVQVSEMIRVIREEEPAKPSTRVGRLGETGVSIAERRGTSVSGLGRQLRDDLDWITLRAMEKDRGRRYESAAALALDVERHLRNEPVTASPPGTWYSLAKFTRRHKIAVAAGATISLSLVLGLALATAGMVQAREAEESVRHERDLADDARRDAETSARRSRHVTEFFRTMLEGADPYQARGKVVTVQQVLDDASRRIDLGELADDPEVEAEIRVTIALTYDGLGALEPAVHQARKALELRRELSGESDAAYSYVLGVLVGILVHKGDLREAYDLAREVLELRERLYGPDHPRTLDSLTDVANILADMGRLEEAAELVERIVKHDAELDDRAAYAKSLGNLASIFADLGDYDRVIPLMREALALRRELFGNDSVGVSVALNNLGFALYQTEAIDEAEAVMKETLALKLKLLGPDHLETATAEINLAAVYGKQARYAEAEHLFAEAVTALAKPGTAGSWHEASARSNRATALIILERYDEAEAELLRAIEIMEPDLGLAHERTQITIGILVRLYSTTGREDEAASWRELLKP